jgi:hypothetical protein
MNRSAFFLSVGALLLVSACSKQEAANTTPSQDALPPAEQTAPPPSDTTATPPPADSSTTTPPPADSSSTTPPPANSGTADPGATPVAARGSSGPKRATPRCVFRGVLGGPRPRSNGGLRAEARASRPPEPGFRRPARGRS